MSTREDKFRQMRVKKKNNKNKNKNISVRCGIRTHAHIRGPEHSIPLQGRFLPWVWRLRPLGQPDISMFRVIMVYMDSLLLL